MKILKLILFTVLLALVPMRTHAATASLTNFNAVYFDVDPSATPTNVIKLSTNAFPLINVTNIYVTNLFATYTFITNAYITYLVVSNIVAGNIQGTTNYLAMFTPDSFSAGDSIVQQNGTNSITVNAPGDGFVNIAGTGAVLGIGTNTFTSDNGNPSVPLWNGNPLGAQTPWLSDIDAAQFSLTNFGALKWPGNTNVLYRSGTDLVYTNGSTTASAFIIKNGNGDSITLTANNGSSATITPSEGALNIPASLFSRLIRPLTGNTYDIGAETSSGSYRDLYLGRNAYILGFGDRNSGNYADVSISHTGTNGSAILDSQSAGTAGPARDLMVASNGVIIAKFSMNSGYTGTGSKVFKDNGAYSSYALPDASQAWPVGGDVASTFDTTVYLTNQASGSFHDVYTVPAGKRMFSTLGVFFVSTNTTSDAISVFVKHSGTYYRKGASNTAVTTNSPIAISSFGASFFEAGDTLSFTNATTGVGLYFAPKLIPDTSSVKLATVFDLVNTPTLLYTVPAGKIAFGGVGTVLSTLIFNVIRFATPDASTIFYKVYIVPPGASADASTLFAQVSTTANAAQASTLPPLTAGTTVWVESSSATAGQYAEMNVLEFQP